MLDFIINLGIKRIGLNNVRQGIIFNKNYNFKIDLYYPYIFITTSNYCLTAALYNDGIIKPREQCNMVCRRVKKRHIDVCGEKMYLIGNSQFYYNNKFNNIDLKKVNRLVKTIL